MIRKYWDEGELNALRHGFEFHAGIPWERAVECTADSGTVRGFVVSREQWARIAAIVVTRDAEQCAKRLQTERRQEQDRRAAIGAAEPPDHWDVRPSSAPELPMPLQGSRPWHCPPTAGHLAGIDVSPYIGQASGRIVLSFNGRCEP